MSTIKSSTTLTTAYSVEADTTGALVIQTGATPTTAVTVSSAQVVTLAQPLPVASGGTGTTSTTFANLTTNVTGTLPVANGGTGATSNAAAPFALKGANSDITSLGGLTTALSLAQGGTAATSASAARTSLGLVIGTDVLAPSGSGASLTSLNASNISSGTLAKARLPTGTVLQVVSTTVTSVVTTTVSNNSTFYAISGLSATITPTSSSSKIFAMVQLVGSGTTGYNYVTAFQLWRTTTPIGVGDSASGFRQASVGNMRASLDSNADFAIGWNYLDSPATTSATTYQVACTVESGNVVINTTANNSSGVYASRSASSITLFEVAA